MKIFKYFIIIVAICGIIGIGDSAVDFISSKNDEVPEEAAEGYANEVQSENTDDELTPDEIIAEKGTSVSDWTDRVVFPEQSDITAWNACSTQRSPYMAVWLHVPAGVRFTEYTIDFKSDHFPRGSYYSLGNWYMDYSSLEKQYRKVGTEYGQNGYAGFQNIQNGERLGIMSFWDIYCTDYSNNVTTIRPEVIYPADPYKKGAFGNEGVGAQCMDLYDWKESNWYRFHLKCVENNTTGHTEVEFWVCDLETGKNTIICAYDMGFGDSAFKDSVAIFLENYLVEYSGDVRTLEVRNPKYLEKDTGIWHDITEGDVYPNGSGGSIDYAGSYDYGVDGDTLWIMTIGVGNTCDDSYGTRIVF